jgi:hypothetical protein
LIRVEAIGLRIFAFWSTFNLPQNGKHTPKPNLIRMDTTELARWNPGHTAFAASTTLMPVKYFVYGFLGPGVGFEVGVRKAGFALQIAENLTVPEGGLTGLDFVMPPESTLSGFVVDPQGNPLGDVGLDPSPNIS